MIFWVIQLFNGLSFAMLLFLISSGFSLIFGLMGVINLAHGSFYLLGAYVGLTVIQSTGSFVLALLAATVTVAAISVPLQHYFVRRFLNDELGQVLLTFGFLLMIADLALWIWGGNPQALPKPQFFQTSYQFGEVVVPSYRFAVILAGFLMGFLLWVILEKTKLGAVIRAAVDDPEMTGGLGIRVPVLYASVFALGAALASLGGVMGGPFIGVYPGVDFEILLYSLVVVIIGGLGSLQGAFVGSLLVGFMDTFGKVLFPELSLFTIFAPMAVILALKPTGLFGRPAR